MTAAPLLPSHAALSICEQFRAAWIADDLEALRRYGFFVDDFKRRAAALGPKALNKEHRKALRIIGDVEEQYGDWWERLVAHSRQDDYIPF